MHSLIAVIRSNRVGFAKTFVSYPRFSNTAFKENASAKEKDKFLICQRPANKARGLLWEFVGGKVEKGETLQQALVRECAEELAITVDVGKQFMQVVHQYPDMLIRLTLFHCTIPSGYPQALEHNALEWIHPSQTDNYAFCPADTDILAEIKRRYEKRKPL